MIVRMVYCCCCSGMGGWACCAGCPRALSEGFHNAWGNLGQGATRQGKTLHETTPRASSDFARRFPWFSMGPWTRPLSRRRRRPRGGGWGRKGGQGGEGARVRGQISLVFLFHFSYFPFFYHFHFLLIFVPVFFCFLHIGR